MLRATPATVKSTAAPRQHRLRPRAGSRRLAPMDIFLPLLLLALAAAAFLLALRVRRGSRRRQQAISQLLDAADALESRLRAARAEIEAIAGSD